MYCASFEEKKNPCGLSLKKKNNNKTIEKQSKTVRFPGMSIVSCTYVYMCTFVYYYYYYI